MLTGLENIRFVARVYGVDIESVIESVREFADLGPFLKEPVRTYSSGMNARLAFGLSMALQFDTYLVDELLAVGDAAFQQKSRAAFRDLLAQANLIMVSHSMGALRDYCDCGLVLHDGQARFHDRLDHAIDDYRRLNA